jgi:hypothetical protein
MSRTFVSSCAFFQSGLYSETIFDAVTYVRTPAQTGTSVPEFDVGQAEKWLLRE